MSFVLIEMNQTYNTRETVYRTVYKVRFSIISNKFTNNRLIPSNLNIFFSILSKKCVNEKSWTSIASLLQHFSHSKLLHVFVLCGTFSNPLEHPRLYATESCFCFLCNILEFSEFSRLSITESILGFSHTKFFRVFFFT